MKKAGDDFFHQATLRICGSLDLDTMLADCYEFIRKVIPADGISLSVYDKKTGMTEELAVVNDPELELQEQNFKISPEAMSYIESFKKAFPGVPGFITNRPKENPLGRQAWEAMNKKPFSFIFSHLIVGGSEIGVISLLAKGYDRYAPSDLDLLNQLNGPFAIALSNALQHREVLRLKEMLADDNRYLNRQLHRLAGDEIIGQNFGLRDVMEMVRQVAPMSSQVLLLGETGVGKEVIANAIHHLSPRVDGPFIKVNCGAIPESLIDSELFGHEKGAFTGALGKKRGRFERAHGGTIFLDEIGELPLPAQVRLLRVIQTREIERVGGTKPVPVDIRIIAATHRNLEEMIRNGRFREDLWFRLNVFPITIPPLRHRVMDIPALVSFFIKRKSKEMNLDAGKTPAPGSIESLQTYAWPGNVRELENVVERALIRSATSAPGDYLRFDESTIRIEPFEKPATEPAGPRVLKMDEAMKLHIESILYLTKGKIQGQNGAAALLGLPPSTLRNRMRKLRMVFGRRAKK